MHQNIGQERRQKKNEKKKRKIINVRVLHWCYNSFINKSNLLSMVFCINIYVLLQRQTAHILQIFYTIICTSFISSFLFFFFLLLFVLLVSIKYRFLYQNKREDRFKEYRMKKQRKMMHDFSMWKFHLKMHLDEVY